MYLWVSEMFNTTYGFLKLPISYLARNEWLRACEFHKYGIQSSHYVLKHPADWLLLLFQVVLQISLKLIIKWFRPKYFIACEQIQSISAWHACF